MKEVIMALIKCPECRKKISNKCITCTNCGSPITKSENDYKFSEWYHWILITTVASTLIVTLAILLSTKIICFHNYSDATVIRPQTCNNCGKINGEPLPLGKIEFPTKGLATMLPVPNSSTGKIEWDAHDSLYIYIGNFTEKDFVNYMSSCSNYGFDIDYQSGTDYYYAKDINNNRLYLNYYENNIMTIQLIATNTENN